MDQRDEADGRNARGKIALLVQYDGTAYNGWQIQNNGRTIQEELEKALKIFFREPCRVVASGRTDTGVHALGQVIHFSLQRDVSLQKICIGLNGILPYDISVLNAYSVPERFHARFSAVEREYRYYIYNNRLRSPFMRYRAMWYHEPLDEAYLDAAASHLVGEKDFASFCKKREAETVNTVRKISEIGVRRKNEYVILTVRGNAFLHNMIRIIVGTLIAMYREGADPSSIERILARADRDFGGATVPPYGLYLSRVTYDPPLDSLDKAYESIANPVRIRR